MNEITLDTFVLMMSNIKETGYAGRISEKYYETLAMCKIAGVTHIGGRKIEQFI